MNYKLIFFDLDGTLIKCKSSWELVHKRFGTLANAKKVLEEYQVGKISYEEFMAKDISSWLGKKKKIHINEIESLLSDYELNNDAKEVISELRRRGLKVIIITACINLLAEKVGRQLGVDVVLSNKLQLDDKGYLTGKGIEFVDLIKKDELIKKVAKREHVALQQTIAVGDTIYDINMLKAAGLGLFLGNTEDIKAHNIKAIHSLQ